jgi:hypothetical protein
MCEALSWFSNRVDKFLILQMAFYPSEQNVSHWRCVSSASFACSLNRLGQRCDCIRIDESLLQQTRIVGIEKMFYLEIVGRLEKFDKKGNQALESNEIKGFEPKIYDYFEFMQV